MLETLASVNWSRWAPAEAVEAIPNALRDLTAPDLLTRHLAWEALTEWILPDGVSTDAAFQVVPFLQELAANPAVPDRGRILVFLADLATAPGWRSVAEIPPDESPDPWDHVVSVWTDASDDLCAPVSPTSSLPFNLSGSPPMITPSAANANANADADADANIEATAQEKRTHDSVTAGIAQYWQWIEDPDPVVASRAAYLLTACPEHYPATAEKFRMRLKAETAVLTRAALIFGLEIVGRITDLHALKPLLDHRSPLLIRAVTACVLARSCRARTPLEAVEALIEAVDEADSVDDLYRQLPWADGHLSGDASLALAQCGKDLAGFALPLILRALDKDDPENALKITTAALHLSFGNCWDGDPLEEDQYLTLNAILQSRAAWTFADELANIFTSFQLPERREALTLIMNMSPFAPKNPPSKGS